MKKVLFLSLIIFSFCFTQVKAQQSDDKTYNFVSLKNPPTYPGGMAEFYKFIGTNLKYPAEALKAKVEGTVHLSFVIEKDGSITDVVVVRGVGSGIDDEAQRILKSSKKWNPGMLNDKPVRVKYMLPIKFSLKK